MNCCVSIALPCHWQQSIRFLHDCTSWQVLSLYSHRNGDNSLLFLEYLMEEMPFPIQRIQHQNYRTDLELRKLKACLWIAHLLQGLMTCGVCGSPISSHYVYHKPGSDKRRNESFICHYACTQYRKYGQACGHSNRVLAGNAGECMVERIRDLVFLKA